MQVTIVVLLGWGTLVTAAEPRIEAAHGQAEVGSVEIHGVAAGAFNEAWWRAGTLHFVADQRHPLIAPQLSGVYRNIYAPSAVETPDGWWVFYGAWDGVDTPNDRIYRVLTSDFLTFRDRQTMIEHGDFVHVCNVNAIRLPDGAYRMVCTAYPDEQGTNKPACFASPDGKTWNGSPAPHEATRADLIEIAGYPDFDTADMNGMNVILYEDGKYRLYFGDFKARGRVYRATGDDGCHFRYEAPCLEFPCMVNDVRKLASGERSCYLMAVHRNTDHLWYTLSDDGMRFAPPKELAASLGDADRYIVAVGWVTRGNRVLGYLYGAGAVPELNRNRVFARWLQKKVVLMGSDGHQYADIRALGPDRQTVSLEGKDHVEGSIQILSEDGVTPLAEPAPIRLVSGRIYRLDAHSGS
jgi:hypothetical protein